VAKGFAVHNLYSIDNKRLTDIYRCPQYSSPLYFRHETAIQQNKSLSWSRQFDSSYDEGLEIPILPNEPKPDPTPTEKET